MNHYFNTNKMVKSFVLAGALSIGFFAGGHMTEAAGPDKVKTDQTAQVKGTNSAKSEVKAKQAVEVQAKYNTYQRFGVHEYWIIDPANETVEIYVLENGIYQRGMSMV